MLKTVIKYSIYSNLYCAVEYTQNKGKMYFLLLKKKKDSFVIEKQDSLSTIEELKKQLPKKQHLFLVINNQHVLTKKIAGIMDYDKAIIHAFSNLKLTDFYLEVLHANNNTFVSICRKDIVDSILKTYENIHLSVVGFSLGNLIGSQLNSVIDNNDEFYSSNAVLTFNNKTLSNIDIKEDIQERNYTINGLNISSNYVLTLSGIIQYFTQNSLTESNFVSQIEDLNNSFKQKKYFTLGLQYGLTFIFGLLLISFIIFNNYYDKTELLSKEINIGENLKKTYFVLKRKIEKKKKLYSEMSSSNSVVSYYLDEIGSSVPSSVLLVKLQYQPKLKSIKKNKEILVRNKQIIIDGKSSNSDRFSQWIKKLENKDWIENVSISYYGTEKEAKTTFELIIKIY